MKIKSHLLVTYFSLFSWLLAFQVYGMTPQQAKTKLANRHIDYSNTAFVDTVIKGDTATVYLFFDAGIDPNSHIENGNTPLLYASGLGNLNMVNILLNHGALPNKPNEDGYTPLMTAIYYKKYDVAMTLLSKDTDINAKNRNYETALILATKDDQLTMMQALLDKGADVNLAMVLGDTPLSIAARNGQLSIVEALLEKGADIERKVWHGYTPLMEAVSVGYPEIVKALINKGANVNATDEYGKTIFMNLQEISRERRRPYIQTYPEIEKLLLDAGADTTITIPKDQFVSGVITPGAGNGLTFKDVVVELIDTISLDTTKYQARLYAYTPQRDRDVTLSVGQAELVDEYRVKLLSLDPQHKKAEVEIRIAHFSGLPRMVSPPPMPTIQSWQNLSNN